MKTFDYKKKVNLIYDVYCPSCEKKIKDFGKKLNDPYSYESVMAKLRKKMGEKRYKSMKGRKGQSLLPDSF